MTTRSQVVEEKFSTIMAMMESQQQRQELILAQTDELEERQREFQQQLEEKHQLRDYVRGLGESMEERLKAECGGDKEEAHGGVRARPVV